MSTSEYMQPGSAILLALHSSVHPSEYTLTHSLCLIGREDSCNVVVNHKEVSRKHARIERRDEGFVLLDADSSNGTYVNGRRLLAAHPLCHYDEIGLAGVALLRFVDQDATVIRPPRLRYRRHEQRFWFKDTPLQLSPNLFRLLTHLYEHRGALCTHEALVKAVWLDAQYDENRRDQLYREVSELRRKLRAIDPASDIIQPSWGTGYMLPSEFIENP